MAETPPPDHAVLLLVLDFPPGAGGIQSYLDGVARALAPQAPLLVVAPGPPSVADELRACPVRRVRWPVRGPLKLVAPLLWAAAGLRHLLASPRRTVVVGHPHLAPAGWLLAWLAGARWVQLAYGCELTDGWAARLLARFWRGPDRIVAISRATAGQLERLGAAPARIVRLPPWIELPDPAPGPRDAELLAPLLERGDELVLCVARMDAGERYKGHDVLLEAWRSVSAVRPTARLALVGDGDDRPRLEAQAERLGLGGRVLFTGQASPALRDALYRRCRLVVLLSRELETRSGLRFEGFGIVLLEAAGFRRATLGGRSGGIPEAIVDGVTGVLVDPTDPAAVAPAIRRLLEDPAGLQRMGTAGRRRVEREFCYDEERICRTMLM